MNVRSEVDDNILGSALPSFLFNVRGKVEDINSVSSTLPSTPFNVWGEVDENGMLILSDSSCSSSASSVNSFRISFSGTSN